MILSFLFLADLFITTSTVLTKSGLQGRSEKNPHGGVQYGEGNQGGAQHSGGTLDGGHPSGR